MKNNSINVHELINESAKNAIREFFKEQKKAAKEHVFHNTKLLMEHYISLKKHSERAVGSLRSALAIKNTDKDIEDFLSPGDYDTPKEYRNDERELEELAYEDEIYIKSIEQSKFRTLTMLTHIDVSLGLLKKKASEDGKMDCYQAFIDHYVKGKTYEDIQDKFHISEATPSRWMNNMCKELGVFLFGIDGLSLW